MVARIYIVAVESSAAVEVRVHGKDRAGKGAIETMEFADFMRLDVTRLRGIGAELAIMIGRPELVDGRGG